MMVSYLQIIALLEMSLTCAVVLIILLQKVSKTEIPFAIRLVAVFLLGNLLFWPLGMSLELPLSAYVRGVTGELSIVTMLLLWSSILPAAKKTPFGFKVPLALIAIAFYPLALGVGMIDPYAWGYGSIAFLITVILFAIVCGLAGWTKGVWIISFAIIAWSAHWHESANLWDYLLDPFLAIWALIAISNAIYLKRREKAQSGYLFRAG
ncbi:MAG: hypothetical protein B7Y05_06135 [Polynucleobacter sp. 24-46-87]|jgi:hypothetical protein|uniref:hypothetical protein n=1 Tax=unclassified Polynucleobacter TaxID=2640945 RepID=UPI000BD771AE|nr:MULTISPECIES: hypothetical protein [unclassified Polynucleobacter]OYY21738.1 MAG: hypothetical protein B7Y67_00600 [Polynucleobacter sp. 35-46-11]OZA14842.1 MAG: hypothetical protein B7Y05_06135 [Polynucleobacter sp. 24-46-87]OZA78408.1 MAG: hypothetical protein B7X71_00885 [Polynucleobacter sp. 39-46-10]